MQNMLSLFYRNSYVIIRNLKVKFLQSHMSLMLTSSIMKDVRNRVVQNTRHEHKKFLMTCKTACCYSKH
jgi:hypothetical protein